MKRALIFISILIVTACTTYKKVGLTQTDADNAANRFPGTSLSDLNAGKALFESNCNKCHSLDKPFQVPEKLLTKVIHEMAGKARLNKKNEDLVYAYLITARTAQKKK